jgi:uncharacterized SAM-dependent methyltransferase
MDAPRKIAADPAFRRDVLAGLAAPIPAVPARWLYDRRGSELFEAITELPEYYPTASSAAFSSSIARRLRGSPGLGSAVVEFGSGSSTKTPILLRAAAPAAYVPIDISGDFPEGLGRRAAGEFPDLASTRSRAISCARSRFRRGRDLPKLGFFPGSTIGNMVARTAVDLLRAMKETLGVGAYLLIGMDRIKDVGNPHPRL